MVHESTRLDKPFSAQNQLFDPKFAANQLPLPGQSVQEIFLQKRKMPTKIG